MCMTPATPSGATGDTPPKVMSLAELRQHPRPQDLPAGTVWCICEVCGLRIQPVFRTTPFPTSQSSKRLRNGNRNYARSFF